METSEQQDRVETTADARKGRRRSGAAKARQRPTSTPVPAVAMEAGEEASTGERVDGETGTSGGGTSGARQESGAQACPVRPFADVATGVEGHFKIHFFGVILGLLRELGSTADALEKGLERFPFLRRYAGQAADEVEGPSLDEAAAQWWAAAAQWEQRCPGPLPLRSLKEVAGLSVAGLRWWITVGLPEEDGRFGDLFAALQGTPHLRRPTVALLSQCWSEAEGGDDPVAVLRSLEEIGLLEVVNPQDPRPEWGLRVTTAAWEVIRRQRAKLNLDWLQWRGASELKRISDLVVSEEVFKAVEALPAIVATGAVKVIVVRGPRHNGRGTVLGAVARAMDRGCLVIQGLEKPDDPRWRLVTSLAVLLGAIPVVEWELGPGETATLPAFPPACACPLGVVLGKQGGLSGPQLAESVTLTLGMPTAEARRELWRRSLPEEDSGAAESLGTDLRLTTGRIVQIASIARTHARLAGHTDLRSADVREAARVVGHQALDSLARRVTVTGDWSDLSISRRTYLELQHLERHCRHRERLPKAAAGPLRGALGCGVRALLSGPSGTGKTLAARLLAATLDRDLYRLDLSTVVNKYIGETEKNLQRVFDRAEELDLVLLLDEGDALLTRRTDVQTSNDRYANLETNFLLQRLEDFDGIVLVTTNARQRIDPAFERRMDVVVEFSPPTMEERWQLWLTHLPPERDVDETFLAQIAQRCEFTGGQIRNATLHATLLALDHGGTVTTAHVESAVRREYVKLGATCPLRTAGG